MRPLAALLSSAAITMPHMATALTRGRAFASPSKKFATALASSAPGYFRAASLYPAVESAVFPRITGDSAPHPFRCRLAVRSKVAISSSALFSTLRGGSSGEKPTSKGNSSKPRDVLAEISKTGELKRTDAAWRNWISTKDGAKFPPESGRYHLFVAYACPWAHRTLIVRALKGLEDVISVTVVHPVWRKTKPDVEGDEHRGWVFGNPDGEPFANTAGLGGLFPPIFPGNEPDPIFNSFSVRELYEHAKDTDGKYSVPVLWDKKLNTIVSNESSEIIRMLNSEFNDFAKNPHLDLYPEPDRESIDAVNDWVYPTINNGVYRCGFATSQTAYDTAIGDLTASFDRVDYILQKQRFIAGDKFTEADVRLFVTLLRFDEVYTVYFKTNTRRVAETPSILNYCREIYQMPGVAEICNMEQIKAHYYCSHVELNKYSIIPRGPDFMKLLSEPHHRG